jgi:hypothetical protein
MHWLKVLYVSTRGTTRKHISTHRWVYQHIKYFFNCWQYSPMWTMASSALVFHCYQSCGFCLQFWIPIIFRSPTESSHLIVDVPTCLVPSDLENVIHWIVEIYEYPCIVHQHKHCIFYYWSSQHILIFLYILKWALLTGDLEVLTVMTWKKFVLVCNSVHSGGLVELLQRNLLPR